MANLNLFLFLLIYIVNQYAHEPSSKLKLTSLLSANSNRRSYTSSCHTLSIPSPLKCFQTWLVSSRMEALSYGMQILLLLKEVSDPALDDRGFD